MNFQSGKFRAFILGKLFALARVIACTMQIGYAIDSLRYKFSELRIFSAKTSPIGDCVWCRSGFSRGQAGNWSRSKFPALKIKTVENGSIRQ